MLLFRNFYYFWCDQQVKLESTESFSIEYPDSIWTLKLITFMNPKKKKFQNVDAFLPHNINLEENLKIFNGVKKIHRFSIYSVFSDRRIKIHFKLLPWSSNNIIDLFFSQLVEWR